MSDIMKKQIGGNHYSFSPIQPIEYIYVNNLGFIEGNIIKYITRHKRKNKAEDVEKVIHYAKMLLKMEYGYSDEQIDYL